MTPEAVVEACDGAEHAPLAAVGRRTRRPDARHDGAPDATRADIPDWLWASFSRQFGDGRDC